jgi:hypothetical protein
MLNPNKLRNQFNSISISGSRPAIPAMKIVCRVKYFLCFCEIIPEDIN